MGPKLTRKNAPAFIERLRSIPEDKQPEWGQMDRNHMYGHIGVVLDYCLGKVSPFPSDNVTFFRRVVLKNILFLGIRDFPHSVPLPNTVDGKRPPFPEGTIEELEAKLDEFFAAQEAGAMKPPPHPYFGDIGVNGWATFHYRHTDHHLRQFGA